VICEIAANIFRRIGAELVQIFVPVGAELVQIFVAVGAEHI
jgi:hypothetical protein